MPKGRPTWPLRQLTGRADFWHPTAQAITVLAEATRDTTAILHLTC